MERNLDPLDPAVLSNAFQEEIPQQECFFAQLLFFFLASFHVPQSGLELSTIAEMVLNF